MFQGLEMILTSFKDLTQKKTIEQTSSTQCSFALFPIWGISFSIEFQIKDKKKSKANFSSSKQHNSNKQAHQNKTKLVSPFVSKESLCLQKQKKSMSAIELKQQPHNPSFSSEINPLLKQSQEEKNQSKITESTSPSNICQESAIIQKQQKIEVIEQQETQKINKNLKKRKNSEINHSELEFCDKEKRSEVVTFININNENHSSSSSFSLPEHIYQNSFESSYHSSFQKERDTLQQTYQRTLN